MISSKKYLNYLGIFLLSIYAFWINWFSANVGVMAIDTFAFFDTGFSILKNKIPIRDYWIFTGIVVDYFQALFFIFHGENYDNEGNKLLTPTWHYTILPISIGT